MKLYAEEELRKHLYNHSDEFFDSLTPIELPSDEEIEKEINSDIHIKSDADFFNGAKWVIEQIKQQDK